MRTLFVFSSSLPGDENKPSIVNMGGKGQAVNQGLPDFFREMPDFIELMHFGRGPIRS
jgi:hypothetical protein